MLKLNSNYWGFNSKEELIGKITRYLVEATEYNYEVNDFTSSYPSWTFSGLPNGDRLTNFVKSYFSEGQLWEMTFSNEEERENECKKLAKEISDEIDLV
jgi:hypothetical protein